MDASNKQVAVIAEATLGTTPSSPAFKVVRTTSSEGNKTIPFTESPERRADRRLAATAKGLAAVEKRITMPFAYDDALELFFASLMCNSWSTNVLKDGSTLSGLTIEEKHEGGTTDPYVRDVGCVVDSMTLRLQNGAPGEISFTLIGMTESTATTAIASSTYAAPSTNDPITPVDCVLNTFFGLSTAAKMMSLEMTVQNNVRRKYAWGSQDAYGLGLGRFRVSVNAEFYFDDLTQYTTLLPGTTGVLDFTAGILTTKKYQFVLPNARVSAPLITDGGNDRDEMVRCSIMAMHDASDGSALKITRAVA